MKRLLAAVVVLALTGPALAGQCPMLWKQIDEKLVTAQLSDADEAKVKDLRQRGEALHKSGDHAASEAALNEALEILR